MSKGSSWSSPGVFANLTNGVSQQPARVRLSSQMEAVENMYPTVLNQMTGRPPLEIVAEHDGLHTNLGIETNGFPFVHSYVRDDSEAYDIFLDGVGGIFIHDKFTGAEKTVTDETSGDGYLVVSGTPEEQFYALTYKDTTWIVNREKLVMMDTTLSSTRTPEALIRVMQAGTDFKYDCSVKTASATYTFTTITGVAASTVNTIATSIASGLNAAAGFTAAGGVATAIGNVVWVHHPTLQSVTVGDNRAGTAIAAFTTKTTKTADLPLYAAHGYKVRVTGSSTTATAQDSNTNDDQYYVFEADNGTSGSGTWVETVAPGIKYMIDPETAPHTLTRQGDGTFKFEQIAWGDRAVGDESTNPEPVFIGQAVHSKGILGNRLGFLSGAQFNYSRVGEENWYEFFKQTTSTQLDDDPLLGNVPSKQVNNIYWALSWNGEIILLGDRVDGDVTYGNLFAQKSLNISTPTTSNVSRICEPVISGNSIFLISEDGDYSNVSEYKLDDTNGRNKIEPITADYLGSYIPKNVKRLVGKKDSFLAMLSMSERDRLYVCSYSNKAGKLIQRAFFRWDFSNIPDMAILDIYIDKSLLYVVYRCGTKIYSGRMDISARPKDTGWFSKCFLDHRQEAEATYDAGTDTSTVTLLYDLPDGDSRLVVNTLEPDDESYATGQELTVADKPSTTTLELIGDLGTRSVFVGYGIPRYFIPNPISAKTLDGSNQVTDLQVQIKLNRIVVGFFDTQYMVAEVIQTSNGAVRARNEVNLLRFDDIGATLDSNTNVLYGKLPIDPQGLMAEACTLKISSDSHLPFSCDMIQWIGSPSDGKS